VAAYSWFGGAGAGKGTELLSPPQQNTKTSSAPTVFPPKHPSPKTWMGNSIRQGEQKEIKDRKENKEKRKNGTSLRAARQICTPPLLLRRTETILVTGDSNERYRSAKNMSPLDPMHDDFGGGFSCKDEGHQSSTTPSTRPVNTGRAKKRVPFGRLGLFGLGLFAPISRCL